MNWKTLSSTYLFRDVWLTMRADKCQRPDGKIIEPYYVYEFPDWVTAVALTTENKVVFVKQYRHALGQTILEIPGGCVDTTDNSYEEACARELLEETGYRFKNIEFLCNTTANPSTNNNMMHVFLATGGERVAEQQLDEAEDIEILLFTMDEVKQLLRENKLLQSMHVTALLYAFERLGELKY
ncbi:MAG: NUDIX hydrolase [Chitinophagaceae bacterium]|jgi:ADP-ribose pyrophosphatase|nr:NUDIX hydrolase [Chitinophagaceae bacterium]